jgi:hypothetical protein
MAAYQIKTNNNTIKINGSGLNNNNNDAEIVATTSTEQLINRLVTKIALNSNINPASRDTFINSYIQYLVRLFSSQTYTPVYDYFEIGQKLKKKCKLKLNTNILLNYFFFVLVINQNKIEQASKFNELEARLSKVKIIKNQAALLQFFSTLYTEQNKYESVSNNNVS